MGDKHQHLWRDIQETRLERKLELWRGMMVRLRGAKTGNRFGVGPSVRVIFPSCFSAGDDVTICEYSYLHCLSEKGVRFGSQTSVDRNLWLHCGGTLESNEHGFFQIGADSYIGCNAVIGAGGGITIGNHTMIGQSVNMHSENHRFGSSHVNIKEQGVTYQGIVIEDDVWVGSKVTILDGVTIGRGCVIGAGAVVTRSIPPFSVAVGAPARVVAERSEAVG